MTVPADIQKRWEKLAMQGGYGKYQKKTGIFGGSSTEFVYASMEPVYRSSGGRPTPGPVRIPTGGGAPLAPAQLAGFERSFGADLSAVRVHTGAEAAAAAQSFGARAFTQGTHVYFAANAYAPGTAEGDRLLSHELVHVVQGQEGRTASGEGVSKPGDALEREAYGQEAAIAAQLHQQPEGEEEEQADAPASGPAEGGEVLRMPEEGWEPKGAVPLSDALDCADGRFDRFQQSDTGVWKEQPSDLCDEALKLAITTGAEVAEFSGYTHAASHLKHYLANTGAESRLDMQPVLDEDEKLRGAYDGLIGGAVAEANRRAGKAGAGAEDWSRSSPVTFVDKSDWYFAIGSGTLQADAVLEYGEEFHDEKMVQLSVFVWLYDSYDWDDGKDADIWIFKVPDAYPGRLHQVGLAKEFPVTGTFDEVSLIWSLPTAKLPVDHESGFGGRNSQDDQVEFQSDPLSASGAMCNTATSKTP